MKVILLKSIPKIGAVNQVVEVNDGFAMNSLIPQGLAKVATSQNIALIEKEQGESRKKDAERIKGLVSTLNKLNGETITIQASANEKGKLFSSVTGTAVIEAIKEEKGLTFDEAHIELPQAIKEVGVHKIPLQVDTHKGTLNIEVVPAK